MGDEQDHNITGEISVSHSGIGWALCGVVLFIAVLGEWHWIKRIDCALGIHGACAEIAKAYPMPSAAAAHPTAGQ